MLVLLSAAVGAAAGLLLVYSTDLPQVEELERYRPGSVTQLYDGQGRVIGTFALQRRVIASYDDYPEVLRNALVSIEDKDFYRHSGINIWRIVGAAYRCLLYTSAATTTTLSSSPNPSFYGQAATLTATVTSSAGAPPDGESIAFMKGTTLLGTGTLSEGAASISTSTLAVGSNTITAVYGGDSNFAGSTSKPVKQVVDKATTTTALSSSQNPSNVGQSVTFTASVTPQFSGTATGSVTFYNGTTTLKVVTLSGGSAEYSTSKLASGAYNITATYNGSTSFSGSSASVVQTVN